jgi:anthranilate/para-aminobenzoate synthase component II
LVDYCRQLGLDATVGQSDGMTVEQALAHPGPLLISPGPGHPADAGISVVLAAACIEAHKPLLGVCLGHQAIALAAGAAIVRAEPDARQDRPDRARRHWPVRGPAQRRSP